MLASYIPFIIALLLILIILTSAILAFLTQKNWATITLISSVAIFLAFIALGIYVSNLMSQAYISDNDDLINSYAGLQTAVEVLGYISPLSFVIGLIGYMHTSTAIFLKAETLSKENQMLANKLNQL